MQNLKPILLVEDDYVDALTVMRSLKELNVGNPIVHVLNGEEAIEYLRNGAREKPCVILLDLNMPRMNGIEFLKIIKADPQLMCIPVIVLTTSKADQDKFDCFDLSVAGYIVKPSDYKAFLQAIKVLDLYWTINSMPENASEAEITRIEQTV